MNTIHIITQAYNAEAFLHRCADSILAQTYRNFRFYILDSASTDKTMDIINDYAKKDSRIIPMHNDYNSRYTAYMEKIPVLLEHGDENDYFMMIDHDDAYHPEAFEKLIKFSRENNLDVAAAKHELVNAATGIKKKKCFRNEDIIYKRKHYSMKYPQYQVWLRTVWNKLIPFHILKTCNFENAINMKFASDTAFILEVITHTNTFGILDEATMDYYYTKTSLSYQFYEDRIYDARILFNIMHDFLDFWGPVSTRNRNFMLKIYFNSMRTSADLIIKHVSDASKRLYYKNLIFTDPLSKEAFGLPEIPASEKYNLMLLFFGDAPKKQ